MLALVFVHDDILQLVGFGFAHAVWSVSDGETLVPFLLQGTVEEPRLSRVVRERIEEAVRLAREAVAQLSSAAPSTAIFFDTWLHLPAGPQDALVCELRDPADGSELMVGLPYQPGTPSTGFAATLSPLVFRASGQFEALSGGNEGRSTAVVDGLMRGAQRHKEAWRLWISHPLVLEGGRFA